MKHLFLSLVLAVGFSAFAAPDDQTPTGDKVTFDVTVQVSVCTLDKNGEIVQCNATNNPKPIHDSMSAELIHSECVPKCTYNDSSAFDKDYTLKDPASGVELPVHLSVWFSRESQLFNDAVPEFSIEAELGQDKRDTLVTLKDLGAMTGMLVNGEVTSKKLDNGNVYELHPYAIIKNFQISKK